MNMRCYPVVLLCLLVMAPTVGAQSISYLSVASAFITQSTSPTATPTVPPPLITREYVIDPSGNGDFTTISAFITGTAGLAGSGYKVVGHLVPGVHSSSLSADLRLRRNQYLRGSTRDASVVILWAYPGTYRFIVTSGSGLENLTWVRAGGVYLCLQEDSSDSDYVQLVTVHRVSFKTLRAYFGEGSGTYPRWGEIPYVFSFGKDSDPDCDAMTLSMRDCSFEGNSIFLSNGTAGQNSPNGTTDVIIENCDIRLVVLEDDETSPPNVPPMPLQFWRGGTAQISNSTIMADHYDFDDSTWWGGCIFMNAGHTYSATVEIACRIEQSTLIERPYPSSSGTSVFAHVQQTRATGSPCTVRLELDGVQLATDGNYQYIDWDIYIRDDSSSYDADLAAVVACHDTDTAKVSRSGNNAVFEQARLIEVDVKGGKDFTTIQDAIDSISDNAVDNQYVILVYPGVYEVGPDDLIELKSYVTIRASQYAKVTIQPDVDVSWSGVSFPTAFVKIHGTQENPITHVALENLTILLDPEEEDAWQYDGALLELKYANTVFVRYCILKGNWEWSWITNECMYKDRGDEDADDDTNRRSIIKVMDSSTGFTLEDNYVRANNDSTMLAILTGGGVNVFRTTLHGYDTPSWSYAAADRSTICQRGGYRGTALVVDAPDETVGLHMFNSGLTAHFNGRGIYVKNAYASKSQMHLVDTTLKDFCIDIDNSDADLEAFFDYDAAWVTRYGRLCVDNLRSNDHQSMTARCIDQYMTPVPEATPIPTMFGAGGCNTPLPTDTPSS